MMYIVDANCISPQTSKDVDYFLGESKVYFGNKYNVIEPSYKDFIPNSMLRRMGKAMKIAIAAGLPLLNKHSDTKGIIISTSTNGVGESGLFLDQIVRYNEATLTPTHFVQSMPNSVASMLALLTKNRAYNTTHTQIGCAFENSIIDAKLLLQKSEIKKVLIGDIDELTEYNFKIDSKRNRYKEKSVLSNELIKSNTKGTVSGEGSSMFIVSSEKENALAEIVDVLSFYKPSLNTLDENFDRFLEENQCLIEEIDLLILGYNGDVEENLYYDHLVEKFEDCNVISYKQLVGEYASSSAFATYMAIPFLNSKKIPEDMVIRRSKRNIAKVLIYNHFQARQHNFILLASAG